MYARAHRCVGIWRPEVDVSCLPNGALPYMLRQDLFLGPSHQFGESSRLAPAAALHLCLLLAGITVALPTQLPQWSC